MGCECCGPKWEKPPSVHPKENDKNYYNEIIFKFIQNEQYFGVIKDSNKTHLIKEDFVEYKKKIEIFFSLTNVANPNNLYSCSLTVVNNANINQRSYLGQLEERFGNNIDFGNSFEIDYFEFRTQILYIKPKINGIYLEDELKLTVKELIQKKNHEFPLNNIGILKLSYNELDYNRIIQLEKVIAKFSFDITLHNIYEYSKGIFFVLNHNKDSGKKRIVYKSPLYKDGNIKINELKIEVDFLCNNLSDQIFIDFYHFDNINTPFAFGKFNLEQLKLNSINNLNTQIPLSNTMNNLQTGTCEIQFLVENKLSFEEKLKNKNMQINLEIAIDYTMSNKDHPTSLHYFDLNELNDYELAMKYCGDILAPYDADQLFPVYGFGGIPQVLNGEPNIKNEVSHCFNINFEKNAEIQGMEGVLRFYRESLSRITLSGNTKLQEILRKVINNIIFDLKNKKYENHYYILLILTDGEVNDIKDTIDIIVEASVLPLSIVVIGIGPGKFNFMEVLDGDEQKLTDSRGIVRKRDIVQFIEFNKFKKNKSYMNESDFAEEVLKEIPRQIDEYYRKCGQFYNK